VIILISHCSRTGSRTGHELDDAAAFGANGGTAALNSTAETVLLLGSKLIIAAGCR